MRLSSVVVPGPPEQYPAVVIEDLGVTVHYDISERGTVILKRIEAEDITSDVLRSIKIGDLRPAIHSLLLDDPSRVGGLAFLHKHADLASPEEARAFKVAHSAAEDAVGTLRHKTPHRGRSANNDGFYRDVAQDYLKLWPQHGQTTAKALAEERGANQSTVYGWIRRAREEGWLTAGQQGRAGAERGWRLIAWESKERQS